MFKIKGSKFVIAFFVLLSLCIIGILIILGNNNENFKTFSTKNWIDNHISRNQMVEDLFQKYNLVGMSKESIISLLGKPEYKNSDSIGYFVRDDGVDPVLLDIDFDKTGTVISYNINQH